MQDYQGPPPPDKDPELWELARRRVSFKWHLATYLIVNVFFWILWYISDNDKEAGELPWPVWPMLGWGIGLAFHFIGAYVVTRAGSVENEYRKLSEKNKK